MTNKIIGAIAALALVLSVIGLVGGNQSASFGGSTDELWQAKGGIKVGTSGTSVNQELVGTCNAATTELPLEATSTDSFTCSVSGAASGDTVQVFLPSDSGTFLGGFAVTYAVASTNTITFGIANLTGSATSSFSLATTSVQYRVTDI